jgi:hypothetical protein
MVSDMHVLKQRSCMRSRRAWNSQQKRSPFSAKCSKSTSVKHISISQLKLEEMVGNTTFAAFTSCANQPSPMAAADAWPLKFGGINRFRDTHPRHPSEMYDGSSRRTMPSHRVWVLIDHLQTSIHPRHISTIHWRTGMTLNTKATATPATPCMSACSQTVHVSELQQQFSSAWYHLLFLAAVYRRLTTAFNWCAMGEFPIKKISRGSSWLQHCQ